jgi:hypothetical protein
VVHVIEGRWIESQEWAQNRFRELAHVGPDIETVLFRGFKNLFRLFGCKRPPIAKNIYELGELPPGGLRDHLFTDELNVLW